ncbi:MAG TPA: DNA mismatch repair protein [Parasegetibacter sp.]
MASNMDKVFITDKQTLEDLNITGRYRPDSLFSIFNQTKTGGGEKLLDEMFHHPLTDPDLINQRSNRFLYFQQNQLAFPVETIVFNEMENYLHSGGGRTFFGSFFQVVRLYALKAMGLRTEFEQLIKGLGATAVALNHLNKFFSELMMEDPENPLKTEIQQFLELYNSVALQWLPNFTQEQKMNLFQLVARDHHLRNSLAKELKKVLQLVYNLDVYISVSLVAATRGLSYAKALPAEKYLIKANNCRHIAIENGVGNPVLIDSSNNLLFLTGANMAGKSTFMKSLGTTLYLAHMGFPLAADDMEFSVKDGVYTSINVPDDINQGYSHFYAEVLRVKNVAEEVASGKNLLIIFDELFKGTNVKDAFDATLAVSEAFSEYKNSAFVISTHIVEVGETLQQNGHAGVLFRYMPTEVIDGKPRYPYTLRTGISSDRHGMVIIKNEKILEIIKGDEEV